VQAESQPNNMKNIKKKEFQEMLHPYFKEHNRQGMVK